MDNNESMLIQELMQIRFLKGGVSEIERYEEILYKLSMTKDIDVIKGLCCIIEDDVYQASAVEYLLEVIITITKKVNIQEGVEIIIKQTPEILKRAREWTVVLHAWIIRENELLPYYIDFLKKLSKGQQIKIIELLGQVREECGQDELINKILGELG